jgi:hypothetical protein
MVKPFYPCLEIDVYIQTGLILLSALLLTCTYYLLHIFGSLRASKSIHQQLIDTVLGTTLRWVF